MEIPIVKNKQSIHFGAVKKCMKNCIKPMYYVHSIIHCLYSNNDVMMMILLNDMEKHKIKNIKLKQIFIHALFITSSRNKFIYNEYYNMLTKMENSKIVNSRDAYCMLHTLRTYLELGTCKGSCRCCLHKSEMHTIKVVDLQNKINELKQKQPIVHKSIQKEFIDTCLRRFDENYKDFIEEMEILGDFKIDRKTCVDLFQSNANKYIDTKDISFLYSCVACIFYTKTYINQSTSNIIRYNVFRGFIDYVLEYPDYNSKQFEILNSICMLAKFSLKFYNVSIVYYILIHAVANTFLYIEENSETPVHLKSFDHELFDKSVPHLNSIHFSHAEKFKFNYVCKCSALDCSFDN